MPLLLLLVLVVASLPGQWPEPPDWLGPTGSALLTWAGVGLMVGVAGLISGRLRRRLLRNPGQRSALLRRYTSWRYYQLLALLTVYLAALYLLGWVTLLRGDGTGQPVPGLELVILSPFLVALVLSWSLFYDVERAANDTARALDDAPFPGRWSYVAMQARHNLILIVPPLLLMIAQQALLCLFPNWASQWFFTLISLALLAAVFLSLPWFLRLLLGLRPLPPGPLRERLLAAARRLNFRCRDILLWDTRNGVANAMVTGLLPALRYVVVTDRLVSDLSPEEIEAVFGHEAGHVKHHHLLYYLVFLLISVVVVVSVWQLGATLLLQLAEHGGVGTWWPGLVEGLKAARDIATLPLIALLGAYLFVVFGFLSRRCERQADIYGCRAVSCEFASCSEHGSTAVLVPRGRGLCATGIRTFIEALEKVARLNGIDRSRPGWMSSWQHSTIARRVEFLERMCSDPAVEPRFQRRVGLVKWALLLGLGAVFGIMILVLVWSGVSLTVVWNSLQQL